MKLGGLTWWRYNYGSILQAYALQTQLNSYDNVDYEIICQYGKKVASADNLKQKLKKLGIRKTARRAFWKFGLKKLRLRNEKIQRFMDEKLIVSERDYLDGDLSSANEIYDGFVCGSDQIWNPELVELDSIYWLRFAEKGKKKIAYAPSVGVKTFTPSQKETVRENLSGFTAVSSREESGTKAIREAMGDDSCVTVLDPTLMVDRELWDGMCAPRKYGEPYLFVYMLRGTKAQRKLAEDFAREHGLKIVTMPFLDNEKISVYDFKFGDYKLWDADPAEFISAIRYADYVITDSFHSMVFSCLYHRPFFVFPKIGKAQLNRLVGLMEAFNIKSRMINEKMEASELDAFREIDWDSFEEILSRKRKFSRAFLERAISE